MIFLLDEGLKLLSHHEEIQEKNKSSKQIYSHIISIIIIIIFTSTIIISTTIITIILYILIIIIIILIIINNRYHYPTQHEGIHIFLIISTENKNYSLESEEKIETIIDDALYYSQKLEKNLTKLERSNSRE